MAKANSTWNVLPHEPLQTLTDNLWRVEGSLPGNPLRRVMAVARRADGDLVVHSAISVDEPSLAVLTAAGTPRYLLVPNGYHRLDAPAWKARFPSMKVLCPRSARAKVQEVVAVDGDYQDLPADAAVQARHLDGTGDGEGVVIVRSGDGASLVFNDVVFNMPHLPGFTGFVLRHLTQSSGGPRISRISRLFLIKDRAALRADLLRLAETPDLRRILVSHHQTITQDPAATLRAVAQTA